MITDRQALRMLADRLDRRPLDLTDAEAKDASAILRRLAGEPAQRAGHRAECPSLLLTKPGKCNCEAPYGAGGL